METRSKRRHSTETISASSESCIISSRTSSRCVLSTGTFRGETPVKDLLFDIEADLFGEEEINLDPSA